MPEGAGLAAITGAARGIGAAVALQLASREWSLVLADACAAQPGVGYEMPAPADLDAVGKRCFAAGAAGVEVLCADVAAPDFTAHLSDVLAGRSAGAAVAAAGVISGGPAWTTDETVWATLVEVNLHGTRRLAEATVPGMVAAGDGRFVAIASAAALRAMPQLAAYSAAKAAVVAYVRALAADLAGTGVLANVVCPGSTRGAMLAASADVYDLSDQEQFAGQQLVRRLLEPEEVAAAAVWLCGPEASALTGAVLPVDGGLTFIDAVPVPSGWRLRSAAGLHVLGDGTVLLGGSPLRILTLSGRGTSLVRGWLAGRPVGEGEDDRTLARRLLDAGLAHPDPPRRPRDAIDEVTIVVPVYADPDRLRACLAPLAGGPRVIVVDDGSPDPTPIAEAAEQSGARYVRHRENQGPAAARNTGLRMAATPLVAFLDADCLPPTGFPGRLLDHLADPAVALVAPRIVTSERQRGAIAAYERARSALDMGPRPSLVRPYSAVWYVPSAAMLARREALGAGFDEGLVLGEDVDLVWRLHDAGWQIRYEPEVVVAHEDRVRFTAWYRRRIAYNESVAPLLTRHPERVPVLFLSPLAALGWGAALAGVPAAPLALAGLRAIRLRRTFARHMPNAGLRAARISAEITAREGRDLGRAVAGPWAPFALAAATGAGRGRRRALASGLAGLVVAMATADWLADRPQLDPARYAALRLADESTRGLGIWLGCLRERDFRALLPRRPPPPSRRSD